MMKIKIPTGYLVVEEKGAENEYPGLYVSFSKDGQPDNNAMVACVEYDTCSDEGAILTETYSADIDEPTHIINYQTGKDRMWD